MDNLINVLIGAFGIIMKTCYKFTGNYGISIIIFTFVTKFILLPVNLLTQKNSIKMVKIKPELDALRIKYIDDKDKFTDEQLALYKKSRYNPFLGVVPLLLQIPIVLGLVGVIYRPLSYVLGVSSQNMTVLRTWLETVAKSQSSDSVYQSEIINMLKIGGIPPENVPESLINRITGFKTSFLGIDLGTVPSLKEFSWLLLIPVVAGLSAAILCMAQNRINVLQISQNRVNKILTTVFMVAFSTYFAFLVPAGVGLYWIFGNLFAIPSMLLTNLIIPPKKYIDYNELEEMKKQTRLKEEKRAANLKRERADYKKFFSVKDMKLMIYSEQNGFYKYYAGMIDYICEKSNIDIHYVTSDPDDNIFKDSRAQIHPYFIGDDKYLIPLFMKLDCDMCIMTMPDLEKYHIKRSKIRSDIEYVYISHNMGGNNLTMRKGALDWYDTVFCTCSYDVSEIQETEELYGLKRKTIVEAGYPLLDSMLEEYNNITKKSNKKPLILIAPSWQPENIIENGVDTLLETLKNKEFDIILRPHPQAVRHTPEKFELLKKRYEGTNITVETDFSSNTSVMNADVMITDWSGICWEYAFTTLRPVLFVNTPMKIMNKDYDKIATVPMCIELRNVIGRTLELSELENSGKIIDEFLENKEKYTETIKDAREKYIFNVGKSRIIYGKYVIKRLT